jgi:predicted TIM-barrel fold metal-dependent hydrolase
MHVPNEFLAAEVRKYDNLYYGASINPFRKDALERLDQAISDNAFLIKWLPSIQLIDPSSRRLIPFYKRMAGHRIPLLCHTGAEYSFSRARNELADPARLSLPLEQGVTVIAAHAATNGTNDGVPNFKRLLPMFGRFPNLYADISSLTQLHKLTHLPMLLRHPEIHDRLVNGTDMPLPNTAAVSPFFFMHRLGLSTAWKLNKMKNPWDLDTGLKRELGVPLPVFYNAGRLFAGMRRNS